MTFTRRIEDFVCEKCGAYVRGTGFTNHCPTCLWSKHVDIDPGDRAELCGGQMEPIALEGSTPEYKIRHKCTKCGTVRRVGTAPGDDQKALLALAQKHAIMKL